MVTGKPFTIEIVSPSKVEYEGEVEAVSVPGAYAPFQILHNHAPIIAELEIGTIRFNDSQDKETVYACGGGFVQVKDNFVSIVVESAEESGSIDIDRAVEAKQRAEERLRKREEYDRKRAELSLARAVNRLRTTGRQID